MNEKTEQIKAVMADEAFVQACVEAENEEAVQKLFAGKGIEMSLTEIELMKEMVGAVESGKLTAEQLSMLTSGGELSEDELENAAGGIGLETFLTYKVNGVEAFKEVYDQFASQGGKNLSVSLNATGWGVVVAGAAAVVGLGYGIYDAVRRRW